LSVNRTTGNVGINQPSPAYKLDVAGDINTTGQYRINGAVWNPQTPWKSNIDGATFNLTNVNIVSQTSCYAGFYYVQAGGSINYVVAGASKFLTTADATSWVLSRVDDTPTTFNALSVNRTTGNVGISQPSPAYKLDVAGDINCSSGTFRVNGIPLAITNQSVVTGTRAAETIYRNTSGKTLFVLTCWNLTGSTSSISFVSDASATPTVVVTQVSTAAPQAATLQLSGMVLPGNYYQCHITGGGVTLASWVEYS
jgi:hypothetical protein